MQPSSHVDLRPALRHFVLLVVALGAGTFGAAVTEGSPMAFGLFASIGLAATSHLAQWSIPPLALFELFRWQAWLTLIMDFILAIIGLFLLHEAVANLVPSACNENYSLSIWANVIGAMAFGLLGCFLGGQKIDHRHVLTLVAFFWVAPFVGFFYGPWYAAQTLLSGCQSIAVSAVVA